VKLDTAALFRHCHEETRIARVFREGWVCNSAFGIRMQAPPSWAVEAEPALAEMLEYVINGKRRRAQERNGWRLPAGDSHDLGQVVIEVSRLRAPVLLAYRFAPLVDAAQALCALPLRNGYFCIGMLDAAGELFAFALPFVGEEVVEPEAPGRAGGTP
jgi:hypothetical protein